MIYLDNAATTFIKPPSVHLAVRRALNELTSPGRGGYLTASKAAETAYRCRERAARLFNVKKPDNVVITFNATHALNIAINTLVPPGGRAVVSGYEHNSVMRPLHALGARIAAVNAPMFDRDGELEEYYREISAGADAVVVNHVSNVFGCVQPIEEIAAFCRMSGVPLIIDASQSAGAFGLDFTKLGAAFMAMPGHKGLYGPQGTGILLCNVMPKPLIHGGTGSASARPEMPDWLPDAVEAGTHNMPGISGLSMGLAFAQQRGEENILRHEKGLISALARGLERIKGVRVYRGAGAETSGVLSFNIEGRQSEDVAQRLAEMGIAVRAGLHCAPAAHKRAGTLETGTVRASVSAFSTMREIKALIYAVSIIV